MLESPPPPLTDLTPFESNAVVEAEVVDLAVVVFYVQLGKAKVDPVATRHTDLPLTHCVIRVCPRVTQRGQSPTAGAEHTGATAITCRTTQAEEFGFIPDLSDQWYAPLPFKL